MHGSPAIALLLGLGVALGATAVDLPTAAGRAEAHAWVEWFTDLAWHAPTVHQAESTALAFQLHDRWLARSNAPVGADTDRLLDQSRELARRFQATLPGLRLAWTGGEPAIVPSQTRLSLARGLEHPLWVAVSNATPAAAELRVEGTGADQPPMVALEVPPGGTRLFRATARVMDAGATTWELRITRTGDPAARPLRVPVTVAEPAVVRGRLLEGDDGAVFPGRVTARGADGVLRHGLALAANPTLSSKPLLDFVFAGQNRSYRLPFFYSDGAFEVRLPPGAAELTLERGFEHPLVTQRLQLAPGEERPVTLASRRFLDLRKLGWVSGDTHIHWARNWWSEDEDPQLLHLVQRAEDLRMVNNLTLKHHLGPVNFIAPTRFPMGPIPGLCDDDYHAQMGEEWRNEEFYGHLLLLNLRRLVQPISTGSMGGAPHFWDWPHNLHAIRETRAQGGIVIEAHGLGRNANVPVDVAHALADSLDQIEPEDYYRFLDCGFQIPLSNGSDHPARVAGCARVYVKTRRPYTYENWIDGIRANRTFTTSGPLLFLEVNGQDIGDVLQVRPDTPLRIRARAVSRHPIGTLQIVSNGRVLATRDSDGREAEITLEIPAGEPRWIVARASPTDRFNALAGPHIAHTSALYVHVDGRPRLVEAAALEWAQRMRRHAEDVRRDGRFPAAENREEAVRYILDGVRIFEDLARQARTPSPP